MIEILGHFLLAVIHHVTGHKVNETLQHLIKNLEKEGKLVNHDLQRAVKESFLRAIKDIVSECQKKTNLSGNDMKWLKQKNADMKDALKKLEKKEFPDMPLESLSEMKDALKVLEKTKSPDMPLESLREIESLFKPSGGMATKQFLQIVEQKLIAEALRDDAAAPEPYKEKIRTDVFKRMCDYFAWEIKNTSEVRHIFDSQTLAQIDARLIELVEMLQRQSKPAITVELDTDFNKLGIPELWAVIEKLQGIVKGKMTGVEAGSVRIFLEGTQEGMNRLESLFKSGELTEILGVPVKDVSIASADAGEEGIIEKAKTWLSSLLWIPEGAGLPATAADISEQAKTFKTEEGEIKITCVWGGETDDDPAYIWLKWEADIKPETELVIRFLNPESDEIRYEIRPGKIMKGSGTFKKEKLGFDPTKEKWGIYAGPEKNT